MKLRVKSPLFYCNINVFSCFAGGFPTPTYEWFKEDYENDRLVSHKVDPLSDRRYTLSGGTLIINNPRQVISHI
jgi:hypothetical protein